MKRPWRRSRAAASESGWLLAGQLLLAVLSVLYPQLGAREGVSSILPPIRLPLDAIGAELDAIRDVAAGDATRRRSRIAARASARRRRRRVRIAPAPRPASSLGRSDPGHAAGHPTRGPPPLV